MVPHDDDVDILSLPLSELTRIVRELRDSPEDEAFRFACELRARAEHDSSARRHRRHDDAARARVIIVGTFLGAAGLAADLAIRLSTGRPSTDNDLDENGGIVSTSSDRGFLGEVGTLRGTKQ